MLQKRFWETPGIKLAFILTIGIYFVFMAGKIALHHMRWGDVFAPGMTIESPLGKAQITERDMISEPGEIGLHKELNDFYDRQILLANILSADTLTITEKDQTRTLTPVQHTLFDLPLLFWIPVIVGFGSILISGWIWSLRSNDLASTLFALSGVAMFTSAIPSAIYTTRELALPMPLFHILEELNALGASLFGITMIALFLVYPVRLKNWLKLAIAECLFFGLWTILFLLELTPDSLNISLAMVSEMLMICVAIGAQFFVTKKDPKARAILTWLGLSVLLGAGAFIVFTTVPLVIQTTPFNQGYSFSFFLIIYLGLAAGIKQFRLFEVGQWAFRFLFYAAGALVLVLLDAVLIYLMGMNRLPALGVALLATGFIYLPLRDILWNVFTKKGRIEQHEVLAQALHVALAPTAANRTERWEGLLKKLFDPLEIRQEKRDVKEVELYSDGLKLTFPPVAGAEAMTLLYPWGGRSLFNLQSEKLARELVFLVNQVESSREAYDRGAVEERRRMAQDLHDDVGARLLTGLYVADEKLRPTLQGALSDIRTIVSGMSGEKTLLSLLLAELRFETIERMRVTDIKLNWPVVETSDEKQLDYHQYRALRSVFREIISNTIRHSEARNLHVEIQMNAEGAHIHFFDDGKGFSLDGRRGNGLNNIKRRLDDIGSQHQIESSSSGTKIHLLIKL